MATIGSLWLAILLASALVWMALPHHRSDFKGPPDEEATRTVLKSQALAPRSLVPGAKYLSVFRLIDVIAWLAYGFAVIPDAIRFGRPWSSVFKTLVDAFAYALLTAGVFAWLLRG